MRHKNKGPEGHFSPRDEASDHREHRHGRYHHHGHHRGGAHQGGHHRGHGRRPFDYGELRLLVLAMIAERPRHGYELIKAIEESTGGGYTPSPGVIYPTLAWLDDMGFASIETDETARKLYRITAEGEAFLVVNRAAADELLARGISTGRHREGVPAPVLRAMENLKMALRLRFRRGELEPEAADKIAAAIDAAAQAVERT